MQAFASAAPAGAVVMPASPQVPGTAPRAVASTVAPTVQQTPIAYTAPRHVVSSQGAAGGIVNINTASQAELESLKRIGPAIAQRIIEYRAQHGAFPNVNALEDVKGIGPKILEENLNRLTVR